MIFDPSARHLAAAHGAAVHGHAAPAIGGSVRGDLTAGKVLRYPRVGKGQCFAVGAERAERREQVVLRHKAAFLYAAHEHPGPQHMQAGLREGHRQQHAAPVHHGGTSGQCRENLLRELLPRGQALGRGGLPCPGVPAAAAPALHGIPAGAALDMGITNKAFDSYEQGLIRDVIAARIPAKLDAGKLFA